jgi:pseudoazurin
MTIGVATTALAVGMMLCGSAYAGEYTVKMLNKDAEGRAMQFEPAFLKIAPGDVVHFVPTDKGHDTESIVVPEGAESWKGKLSQPVDVTFTVEGLYAFRCLPHFGLGMVGLIEVGHNTSNLLAVQQAKLPGKAKPRMTELLDELAKVTPAD